MKGQPIYGLPTWGQKVGREPAVTARLAEFRADYLLRLRHLSFACLQRRSIQLSTCLPKYLQLARPVRRLAWRDQVVRRKSNITSESVASDNFGLPLRIRR